MVQLLLIALGLAMDAFSVSVVSGICHPGMRRRYAVRAALFFGFFQGAMPLLGWLLGSLFSSSIKSFDHWIAFALLALIGLKMSIEAFRELRAKSSGDEGACRDPEEYPGVTKLGSLVLLSIATSIDALALGITLSLLGVNILLAVCVIAAVTFVLCLLGILGGKRIGVRLGEWAELAGGLVLVGIGLRILLQHVAQGI